MEDYVVILLSATCTYVNILNIGWPVSDDSLAVCFHTVVTIVGSIEIYGDKVISKLISFRSVFTACNYSCGCLVALIILIVVVTVVPNEIVLIYGSFLPCTVSLVVVKIFTIERCKSIV